MLSRLKSTFWSEFSGPSGVNAELRSMTVFVFPASSFFLVFLDPDVSFLDVKTGESATELIPPPEGGVQRGLSDHFCTKEKTLRFLVMVSSS